MPKFFFHFEDGAGRLSDHHGMTLPDAEAAWYQGVRSARAVSSMAGRVPNGCRIEIEDERGDAIGEVRFEELIGIGA